MSLRIEGVSKTFNGFQALKKVNLEVKEGEILALLGSSGCGKTTLLRIIAGLIEQTEGKVWINETDISGWPAQKRNTAMVFQNYALFPHMNLEENIAYGLTLKKMRRNAIRSQVNEVLKQVQLDGLNKRKIQELSGGQKQRAALARALITKPDILLFDEPLSNLDEKLRVSMREEISRIQRETGITSIYVTHDQKEAMAIAHKIAVMSHGEVVQWGEPEDIFYRPVNAFTADFMGRVNVFECQKNSQGIFTFLGKTIETSSNSKAIQLLLPPEEVDIYETDKGQLIQGTVVAIELSGALIHYRIAVKNLHLYAYRLRRVKERIYSENQTVWIDFDIKTIHIFEER
ncbi:ABC transporter ATP-binding protein [Fusibacter ferrireducens]|uniref:ABC transporter ATP-binding protein n=1 Tax=Fusibacter ferrireducens TaxID=2785058 RepID=A0ABR9ZPW5_9FIRM|nr:ABC transporter ATP-binding protein [Fusibacter ferrireducens]MBF4692513.1 ABC transporter ATP-binding protein [Fusibacter ferrireducens]